MGDSWNDELPGVSTYLFAVFLLHFSAVRLYTIAYFEGTCLFYECL